MQSQCPSLLEGRARPCWHPKYPKTQVTKKAVTDSKPVQLGILGGW